MVRVIDFVRGKRDPSDIGIIAYPCDPSRIPAKSDGRAGRDFNYRSRRHPEPSAIDEHPVAVMAGDVSERFCGHPDLISVIIGPSADREGRP